MKLAVTLEGSADLRARLRSLPKALSVSVQRKALLVGAEPIRARAATLAPRNESAGAPHLADHIVTAVSSARTLAQVGLSAAELDVARSGVVVEIGPSRQPSDHFYGYFQEFGTVHHAAQPFMRPAFDTQASRSLAATLAALWAAVRQALPQSFSGRSVTGGHL
jgi:HK97 gp10 family phage protein